MTKFEKTSSFSRRSLLLGGGALVVSVGAAVSLDTMLSINAAYAQETATAAKPPLTPDQLSSYIAVNADGSVMAYFGKMDMGHGLHVAIGQIVAEELDIPFKSVKVIMGDTGALALGGALGAVAILLKSEFLVVFVGGVFVAETTSVLIQRMVFKYRRKRHGLAYAQQNRVFLRAPLHHHFELKGWPETQVVVRFWILGILCAFVALSTLKLR